MTRTLRIGTRGSELALVQARWVAARLAEHGVATELEIIRTEGDERPVDTAWGEGAFVARIVAALVEGRVDLAVHSAKDVPTTEPDLLVIAAYPPREDPRDALVCRVRGTTLATLPHGARVGTDSPRRVAFLRAIRPDLELHPLHGNVDTRLAKLDRGDSDALVLAVAGLTRLGRADRIDEVLPSAIVPSAPGQGSLALQTRAGDAEAIEALGRLDDPATRAAVEAERALLAGTGGGCRSPIGVIATVDGDELSVLAGAARTWAPAPDAQVIPQPVGWVRGCAPVQERIALAERLAAHVVALRARPRVLVTRPSGRGRDLLEGLAERGVDAVWVPAIEIRPAGGGGSLDSALAAAQPADWIVLTSANAAHAVLDAASRVELEPLMLRWAAVGESTAKVLHDAEIGEVFVPSAANGASLARELPIHPRDRVLVPRADIADGLVADTLRERGVTVTDVVAYETVEAPEASRPLLAAALDDGPVDALVLTSGSTARGLLALAAPNARDRLAATPVIAAGASTAAAARAAGYTTVLTAPSPAAADLVAFTAEALGVADARSLFDLALADHDTAAGASR
ncbi:MAG TPA: hydroxymethylbilane synthase [Candidatus Limnocylindrales bacterium]